MPGISVLESEIRSIVRGENGRHAALLGLTVPTGTLSASRLALTTVFIRSFIFGTSDSVH